MLKLCAKLVNLVKGKEKADWVTTTWRRTHDKEYKEFVKGIDKMAEGDMTAAFEMYSLMKECMSSEAIEYYNIIQKVFSDDTKALQDLDKLKHTNEITEAALNGKTLEINVFKKSITITDKPHAKNLIVKANDVISLWDRLPLYTKAFCKTQFLQLKESCPFNQDNGLLDAIKTMAKIHYVANMVFMPDLMANLYDKAVKQNNGLLFSMYYFVTFDQGLKRMARIFSSVINNEVPDIDGLTVFKATIYELAMTSIVNGHSSKESWKETAIECNNEEAWKEIMFATQNTQAKHGKLSKNVGFEDLLICSDKQAAIALMKRFMKEHPEMCAPAYLRWCLDESKIIKSVPYMVYHRTLEILMEKKIDSKKPQERYGLLKNGVDKHKKHIRIWDNVNIITNEWLPLFRSTNQ